MAAISPIKVDVEVDIKAKRKTFSLDVPPEPVARSVVLDRDGDAWQRSRIGGWWNDVDNSTWVELLARRGPLTLIYDAAESED